MRPILIPTLLTLLAGTVRAEDLVGIPTTTPGGQPSTEQPKDGEHPPGKHLDEILQHFDKDGDGKLNEEEKAAAKAAHEARVAEMKEKNPELFKKLDLDGDGKLSPEEMRRAHEMRRNGEERKDEMLKRFDKDGDGKLSEEEKAAAKADHDKRVAEMKERNPELFKKLDQDGDGKLSPVELRRGQELHDQRQKGGAGDGPRAEGEGRPPGAGGAGKPPGAGHGGGHGGGRR